MSDVRRSLLAAVLSVSASLVGVAGCGGGDAPSPKDSGTGTASARDTAAATSAATPADSMRVVEYEGMGEASGECSLSERAQVTGDDDFCTGYFGVDWSQPASAPLITAGLQGVGGSWVDKDGFRPHRAAIGSTPSVYKIMVLRQARRARMKDLGQNGLLVAKFVMPPRQPKDHRYGIENSTGGDKEFHLVITAFAPGEAGPEHSKKMATWTLYERRGGVANTAYAPVSTGKFAYCKVRHDAHIRRMKGTFARCDQPERFQASLREIDSTLVGRVDLTIINRDRAAGDTTPWTPESLQRALEKSAGKRLASVGTTRATAALTNIVAILNDLDAPAWLHCGPGCCTADDF